MAVVFVMLSKDSYKSSGGIIIKVKRGNYATYGTPWVVFFLFFWLSCNRSGSRYFLPEGDSKF